MEEVKQTRGRQDKSSLGLTQRPKTSEYLKKIATPVKFISNMYQVAIKNDISFIYHYEFEIKPAINDDNTMLKSQINRNIRDELQDKIGSYVHSGNSIFAKKELKDPLTLQTQIKNDKKIEEYVVRLLLRNKYDINDIQTYEGYSNQITMVLNITVKQILKELNLIEIGRNSRYYNKSETFQNSVYNQRDQIDYGLAVWRGYQTSIQICQQEAMLQLDFASRVLRKENGLQYINQYKNKEEAKSKIEGRSLMANYGNYRMYRITEIDYKMNPQSTFQNDAGEKISFAEYYQKTYNMKVKDLGQPLFRVEGTQQNGFRDIYLIPEFMMLTGLEDEEVKDGNLMRAVAQFTQLEPGQRDRVIKDQMRKMISGLTKEGMVIKSQTPTADGYIMQTPTLLLGGNAKNQIPNNAQFQFRDKVYQAAQFKDWVLVYQSRGNQDDAIADEFVDNLKKSSGAYGIVVDDPGFITVNSTKPSDWINAIDDDIQKNGPPMIVVTLIPFPAKNSLYKPLKEYVFKSQGVPHQNVVINRNNKNALSVASQILLQMNSKVGMTLWKTPRPEAVSQKLMIIGIDIYGKDLPAKGGKGSKRLKCAGFVATLDEDFTQYFSKIVLQPDGDETVQGLVQCTLDALQNYLKKNKELPDTIVVYRDGVSEGQTNQLDFEINQILKSFSTLNQDYNPQLAFITINQRINNRFFYDTSKDGGRGSSSQGGRGDKFAATITNPPTGSVVASGVVSSGFDFYLCAQQVTQGTCTPTHFSVLYNTVDWPEEVFWQLTYFQCFNYYNWFGAVRVPAQVQYANKLAYMIGQTFKENNNEKLANTLFFL